MNEYEYKYEDKCWFNGSCYIQKTKGCNRFCALRREFDYLLFASEVPEKFKSYDKLVLHPEDEDVETFITLNDIKSDIDTFVDEGRFLYIWGKTAGSGKAQPLYSKLLTPNGYITMGDIKVGDEVYGEDGLPHKILGVFPQGKKKVYELTFSDGSKCRCSEDHLWTVSRNNSKHPIRTVTLREILDDGLCATKYLKNPKDGYHWKYKIPISAPIAFSYQEVPLDAWLLGALLGDGGFTKDSIMFCSAETDILDRVRHLVSEFNCELSQSPTNTYDYRIIDSYNKTHFNRTSNLVKKAIVDLGLYKHKSENKFIPKCYLFNSVAVRIKLLQGLIDTDGTISKGSTSVSFSTSSKQLAYDIQFLVQSLGGTCTVNEHEAYFTYRGEHKQGLNNFELYIRMPKTIIPCSSEKHLARYKIGRLSPYRSLRKIEYIGEEDCQCIYVNNPTHLYLTDNMIVTHNTSWSIKIMLTYLAMKSLGNGFNPNVAFFVYVPNFLFKAKNFENKEERQEVLDKALNVDLLILDDISATQISNYDSSVLSDVIDARYRENKATIFTSNLSPSELSASCGERTADRVLSDIALEIKGAGHRESTNTYKRKGVK